MMDGIKEESVGFLFNLEVQVDTTPGLDDEPAAELAEQATASAQTAPAPPPVEHPAIVAKGLARPSGPKALTYTAPSVDGEGGSQQVERSADDGNAVLGQMYTGTPRNAPCPCGSGGSSSAATVTQACAPPDRLRLARSAQLECRAQPAALHHLEPGRHCSRPLAVPDVRRHLRHVGLGLPDVHRADLGPGHLATGERIGASAQHADAAVDLGIDGGGGPPDQLA